MTHPVSHAHAHYHARSHTHSHTHARTHTHTCIRTVEHAYGPAAKNKGKDMRKLHVGSITMRDSNGDMIVVENTVFAPMRDGWLVSALP